MMDEAYYKLYVVNDGYVNNTLYRTREKAEEEFDNNKLTDDVLILVKVKVREYPFCEEVVKIYANPNLMR